MNVLIPYQPKLSQPLPEVFGCKDFRELQGQLDLIERLITASKIDAHFVRYLFDRSQAEARRKNTSPSPKFLTRLQEKGHIALRCAIARQLFNESFRRFSCHLAESHLLRKFCQVDRLGPVKVPSKSELERYEKLVPERIIRELTYILNNEVSADQPRFGLKEPVDLRDVWVDLTCLKTDIHFPVDWLLLRDAVRTLIKATILIRKRGLLVRMDEPAVFIRDINKQCIAMTQEARRKDGRRRRKKIFRGMKKMLKRVRGHAERHRLLLAEKWQETDLSWRQAKRIIERIKGIEVQLPQAVAQAHERIIGGRKVANADKLLSLYETDTRVIVRGKAGAAVEFGNTLLLAEQADGLIVDWRLFREQAPADSRTLPGVLARYEAAYGRLPHSMTGDRGMDSADNRKILKEAEITNYICPRSVGACTRKRNSDEQYKKAQTRRAQTEGRIGILKNSFLGRPLRSKGFRHREISLSWCVLAHNLWLLARLPRAEINTAAA